MHKWTSSHTGSSVTERERARLTQVSSGTMILHLLIGFSRFDMWTRSPSFSLSPDATSSKKTDDDPLDWQSTPSPCSSLLPAAPSSVSCRCYWGLRRASFLLSNWVRPSRASRVLSIHNSYSHSINARPQHSMSVKNPQCQFQVTSYYLHFSWNPCVARGSRKFL